MNHTFTGDKWFDHSYFEYTLWYGEPTQLLSSNYKSVHIQVSLNDQISEA